MTEAFSKVICLSHSFCLTTSSYKYAEELTEGANLPANTSFVHPGSNLSPPGSDPRPALPVSGAVELLPGPCCDAALLSLLPPTHTLPPIFALALGPPLALSDTPVSADTPATLLLLVEKPSMRHRTAIDTVPGDRALVRVSRPR